MTRCGDTSGRPMGCVGLIVVLVAATATLASAAEVRPARVFSSHMVLQRDQPLPVWGSGPDGETVEVAFAGQKKSVTVADGRWEVVLDPMPGDAAGRQLILTSAGRTTALDDIVVGDVWLASGQSNMQMALANTVGGKEASAASADPLLRFFITPMKLGPEARSIHAAWQTAAPGQTARLTAVGYHFARELCRATGIPIGIVQCAYGGSRAESWCSPELMSGEWSGYERFLRNQKPEHLQAHPQVIASRCYESMLFPLIPFAFRGALWYQGEGNSGTPAEYQQLLPAMIGEFRRHFRRDDMQPTPARRRTSRPPCPSRWRNFAACSTGISSILKPCSRLPTLTTGPTRPDGA